MIPGGTGYLGQALAKRLVDRGDDVVILTRGPGRSSGPWRTVTWDASTVGDWVTELEGADAIVHLNGRRVDTRATRRNVDELISSRVEPVRAVGQGVIACEAPPPTWVQSSSLAIFGEGGDQIIDESTTPSGIGPREMVTVCLAWEAAFAQAATKIDRPVLLRIGIGLGGHGDPATKKLAQIVGLGLGGRVGSGHQWVSWIGLDDLVAVMLRAIDDPGMRGTYHVTSPNPVTNAEMMATYRRLLGRRLGLPTPAIVAKLGARSSGAPPAWPSPAAAAFPPASSTKASSSSSPTSKRPPATPCSDAVPCEPVHSLEPAAAPRSASPTWGDGSRPSCRCPPHRLSADTSRGCATSPGGGDRGHPRPPRAADEHVVSTQRIRADLAGLWWMSFVLAASWRGR